MNNRLVTDSIAPAVETARAAPLILPPRRVAGVPATTRDQDHALAVAASRRRVLTLGLAAGLGGLAATGAARPAAAAELQYNWRDCRKCGGLFFATNGRGVCPKGGGHKAGNGDYYLRYGDPPPAYHEQDWRYCGKCGGLFYSLAGPRVCPKGGEHRVGSINYELEYHDAGNPPSAGYEQNGWRYCSKCGGLFYAGNGRRVFCPKGGGHKAGNEDYSVNLA